MNWRSASTVLAVSAALVGGSAHAAAGDCTISITPGSNAPNLGKIVKGSSGSTTFTLPLSGSVTQSPAAGTAGAAILLHPGSVTGYPLHVTLNAGMNCKGPSVIPIGLQIIAGSGPQFTTGNKFYVHPTAGFSNTSNLTVTTGTFNMTFSSNSANATATFDLGMDVSLSAASGAGAGTWTTKVTAQ
jgi:hypothetical protein